MGDFIGSLDLLAAVATLLYIAKLLVVQVDGAASGMSPFIKRSLLNQNIMPRY